MSDLNANNPLLTQGFTVIADVLTPAEVADVHAGLTALYRATGHTALYAQADVVVGERVHVSPVGMTFAGVIAQLPQIERILLHPRVLAQFHAVLGPALELEISAGVLSDATRPFFFWHNHLGGIDGPMWRGRDDVTLQRIERLACTTYLAPLDDDHGVLLLQPRQVGDPVAAPFVPGREPWPTQVELRCPPGSTVLLDQVTWHAVTPMRAPGLRAFVSFFVRRAGLEPTERCDATVREALCNSAALAQVYAPSRSIDSPSKVQVLA